MFVLMYCVLFFVSVLMYCVVFCVYAGILCSVFFCVCVDVLCSVSILQSICSCVLLSPWEVQSTVNCFLNWVLWTEDRQPAPPNPLCLIVLIVHDSFIMSVHSFNFFCVFFFSLTEFLYCAACFSVLPVSSCVVLMCEWECTPSKMFGYSYQTVMANWMVHWSFPWLFGYSFHV